MQSVIVPIGKKYGIFQSSSEFKFLRSKESILASNFQSSSEFKSKELFETIYETFFFQSSSEFKGKLEEDPIVLTNELSILFWV